jgi:hypothetical protein
MRGGRGLRGAPAAVSDAPIHPVSRRRTTMMPSVVALGAAFQPTTTVLQAVPPTLQVLAFPLPRSPTVLVAPSLQPLPTPLPAPSLPLQPVPVALEALAASLHAPVLTRMTVLVAGPPAVRGRRGALDRERIRGCSLGGQRHGRAPECCGDGERRGSTGHHCLPAAVPRGSMEKHDGIEREGDDEAIRALSRGRVGPRRGSSPAPARGSRAGAGSVPFP